MKEGYKKTEVGWIPNEWEVKTIGDLFEFKNGLNKEKEFFGKGTKIINYVDVFRNRALDNNIIQGLVQVSEKEKQLFNTKKGDVFFTRTSETVDEIGMTAVLLDDINDLVYSGFVLRARPKTEELDLFYKKYCFSEFYTRKEIMRKSSCTTRALTSGTLLKDVLIKIPIIKEQQKIAEILSTVDSQIDDTDKLIEKTKELKKGLMQRLLTKGIGHTEFKMTEIGEIPVEWEVKNLLNLSLTKGEYGIGASATEYVLGKPRYLRITDIGEDSRLLNNEIRGFEESEYENFILKEGDIVFARTGNTTGKSYVYNINDGELVYAGFLIRFRINKELGNENYIKYVLQTKRYWDWVKVMSTRSGQPGINSNEYGELKIQLPHLDEQNKIANILSTVDNQLEEYENKKSKLEQLKKALMQQLLTGKIRVKI